MSSDSPKTDNEYIVDQEVGSGSVDDKALLGDNDRDSFLVREDNEQEPALTVVMPTLNEEEGIAECIEMIKTAMAELAVHTEIIISDSSTDRTPEIAREMGAIVVEPEEGGYGNAYKYAFEKARGEYIAIGDADTTYDFEELPKLFELVSQDDVDMAMGSRLNGEIKSGAMPPLHQYLGNPLLTRFLNAFYDAGVSDAHSGFRVIDSESLEELELKTTGMEFASEMIMDAAAKDMTIEERPITYHPREGEATLDSFQDGWRHVRFMLVNAPGYLFTVPAVLLSLFGIVFMGLSFTETVINSVSFGVQTFVAGLMMTTFGIQIGTLTMFSSVATNPIREPSDPITRFVTDRFKLEQGATFGVFAFAAGASVLGYRVLTGTLSSPATVGSVALTLFGVTAVLFGVMTVFSSFFFSMLRGTERMAQ